MGDGVTGDIEAVLSQDFGGVFTRRQYLVIAALQETGTDVWTAIEAVSTTAIEHPEWDLDEEKTWEEWHGEGRLQ